MWKRLSDDDISKAVEEEERRRRRWRRPVLTAVLMAAAIAVAWSFGFRGGYISSGVVLMGPATRLTDPSTLGIFTIVFGLVLYQSRRKMIRNGQGLFGGAPTVLCDRCQKAEAAGASPACECGGRWEPIHHWEWIDRTN
jgi:hypothetical protein